MADKQVRVDGTSFYYDGEIHGEGDTLTVSEDVAADNPRTLTVVDEGDTSDDSGESNEFDAESFVDDHWQSVKSAIADGEADGHLDEVREAEHARDDEPRDSVLSALDNRE